MSAYSIYYLICLLLSAALTIVFVMRWTPQIPVHYPLLFLLIPLTEVGYFMFSLSTTLEEALLANKMTYFGGCFIQPLVLFSILSIYNISFRKSMQAFFYAISMIMYGFVLTIGFNQSFYKAATLEITEDGAVLLNKTYGVVHVLFYLIVILYMFSGILILIYAKLSKRNDVSTKTLGYYVTIEVVTVSSFFFGRMITKKVEMIAFSYVITQAFFLMIMSYIRLYNTAANAAAVYEQRNNNGFITFSKTRQFIGATPGAINIYPELADVHVDTVLDTAGNENFATFDKWISHIIHTGVPSDYEILQNDHFYSVNVNFLKIKNKIIGYCIALEDITQSRKYAHLLEDYSRKLNEEVTYKTEHIKEMQDKMILSFAEMVENRDSSTGGHIKRTSRAVQILVSKIRDNRKDADSAFCSYVVNAAPMHDLGKIAIPDAILLKPGPYESWEHIIMHKHAEKGAQIIHRAFEDYDDADFKRIAENIAHYHHERWDGGGYPLGLSSTDIPLEARIMAIVDVYDALVTERTYREILSFEDAYNTIMNAMGTQFDPSLAKYFAASRQELEEFYKNTD
ncbi:MAG: HD domain-containing protein [Lachnospiraceae bacterium]|nr:HD domain-containing protein [Lachnospiraceae bacterium]